MKIIISFLLVIMLSACQEKYPTLQKTSTIVAFGDSLTFGYGAPENKSYPAQLSAISGYQIINAGLNGDTAANGKERIIEVVEKYKPNAVILSLGGNDMLRRQNQNLERDLNQIVTFLKSNNIRVILLAEPQPTILGRSIGVSDADVYEKVADRQNIPLLSEIFSRYLSDQKYKSDLIHLNAEGYKRVAEDIANELKDMNIFKY